MTRPVQGVRDKKYSVILSFGCKVLLAGLLLVAVSACAAPSTPNVAPAIPVIDVTLVEGSSTRDEVHTIFGPYLQSFSSGGNGSGSVRYSLYEKYPIKIIRVTYVQKNGVTFVVPMAWGRYYGEFKVSLTVYFNKFNIMERASFGDMP